MFSSIEKQTSISVKRLERSPGHCIVVDFHDSNPPVLWQLGLGGNQSVVVTLRGKDDDWAIGINGPKGEFLAVAKFDNWEDAEAAYMSVQKAMMKGRHFLHGSVGRWTVSFIIAVLVVLLLVFGFSQYLPQGKQEEKPVERSSATEFKPGEPVLADEVLKAPEN